MLHRLAAAICLGVLCPAQKGPVAPTTQSELISSPSATALLRQLELLGSAVDSSIPVHPGISALFAALRQQGPLPEVVELTFGVYTTDKATVIYRGFTPILESLQLAMEQDLGTEVDIQLKIYKDYDSAIIAFIAGEVDFVRFGPASYIISKERNPGVRLLAMEKQDGGKRFEGYIVVRRNSPIRSLADLKGKRFAFGDRNSTIGRFLSQDLLQQAGLLESDFRPEDIEYLGRHDLVFRAVEIGDFDAGALKSSTYEKMNKSGRLRILERFDNVTKPWAARAGLEPRLRRALRRGLLNLTDENALAPLKLDGFLPATDEEYEFVRRGMRGADKFAAPPK